MLEEVPPYPNGGDGLGEAKADFTDTVIDNAFRAAISPDAT